MGSYQSNSWSSASTTRVGVKVQMPQITFTLVTIVRTLVPDEVALYDHMEHTETQSQSRNKVGDSEKDFGSRVATDLFCC